METRRDRGEGGSGTRESANSVFKRRADRYIWPSLVVAAALHYAVLAGLPWMARADIQAYDGAPPTSEELALLPPIQLAATSAPLPRPPAPISDPPRIDVSTVDFPVFEPEPIPDPPPIEESLPPADALPRPVATPEPPATALGDDRFIPSRVPPDLRNRAEVRRALERYYPQRLINAGIGGTVMMMFWIDETGTVVRYEIQSSSGIRELDDAAARVVEVMRFSPLLQNGQGVPVVVALPITFEAR